MVWSRGEESQACLRSQAALLRNEIALVRHDVVQARWLDAPRGTVVFEFSKDLEGLDHHEASVSDAEMCNQRPSNKEKAEIQMKMKIRTERPNICRWLNQEYPKHFKSLTYAAKAVHKKLWASQ